MIIAVLVLGVGHSASARSRPSQFTATQATAQLKRVNALRRSFGAPRLTLDKSWSTQCAKHSEYVARHGLMHEERPNASGYTPGGALAGRTSVLFAPARDPFPRGESLGGWEDAPYHQLQVLNPLLRRTGIAKGCMVTLRGIVSEPADPAVVPLTDDDAPTAPPSPPPPRLFAWPGQGARGVPSSIDACSELPSNPFAEVGWSCGDVGTALYLYALDGAKQRCFAGEAETVQPSVAVTVGARQIPTLLAPTRSSACGWVAVTGRRLGRHVLARITVTYAGATLTHTFSTG